MPRVCGVEFVSYADRSRGGNMNEVDALLEIASAIRTLAIAVGGIGTVLWLFLFFKKMG